MNKTVTKASGVIVRDKRIPRLYRTTTNIAFLSVSGRPKVADIRLPYSRQQTTSETESDAIRMFNVANGSMFERIRVDYAARGTFNCGGYTYSTAFRDISLVYCSITMFGVRNSGDITGNNYHDGHGSRCELGGFGGNTNQRGGDQSLHSCPDE